MPDLCQLADVKDWLGIPATVTTDDAKLSRLISATSADFLSEIDRYDFLAADYTEVKRGRALVQPPPRPAMSFVAGRRLVMRHWPINSVTSLVLDGVTLPKSADGIAGGWYLDRNTDPENINVISLIDYLFTRLSTATIVYNAGYASVPADVTQAIIEWVAARYQLRSAASTSSVRVTEGRSQSEQVNYVPWDMPRSTARIVERYKTNTMALMYSERD